jgi:exosortase
MDSGMPMPPAATEGAPLPIAVQPKPELPVPAILFFLALLILLFFPVLGDLMKQWFNDENMGYAFFVPLVVGYIVWLDRESILAAPVKPYWPAMALVVWGFLQMLLGLLSALSFVSRTAFVISIAGVLWTVAGTAVIRTLRFPIVLLLFMFPIPLYVYQRMTIPLQLIASQLGAAGLGVLRIPVLLEGNVLNIPDRQLDVVEACSGIRSLLSLTFLSLAYGRLFETRTWVRITLFLATVPIAILCNGARITLTGILTQYWPAVADGIYHAFEGWVIFMFELVALVGFHKLLDRFGPRS